MRLDSVMNMNCLLTKYLMTEITLDVLRIAKTLSMLNLWGNDAIHVWMNVSRAKKRNIVVHALGVPIYFMKTMTEIFTADVSSIALKDM